MPASSTKLPDKALAVIPLAKKDSFAKPDNEKSRELSVAEKTEDLQTLPEPSYLINKNKSLKLQFETGKPPYKSNLNEDKVLDLSTGVRQKFPENKKSTLPQSSDGGWDFLGKLSKFFY